MAGGFDRKLNGTTAIAVSENDQTAPARILSKFANANEQKFNLKAGYVEGVVYDENGVKALSKIPSKEVLLFSSLVHYRVPSRSSLLLSKAVGQERSEEAA